MENIDKPNEILEILGDRNRRMTQENTRETRENWFRLFDTTEIRKLQASIPIIPVLPREPSDEVSMQRPLPVNEIVVSSLCLIIGTLIFFDFLFVWLGLAISLYSYIRLIKGRNSSGTKKRQTLLKVIVFLYTILIFLLPTSINSDGVQIGTGLAHYIFAASLYLFVIQKFISERKEVDARNAKIRTERISYEKVLSRNVAAKKERDRILEEIRVLTVDVLHLREMAKLRREMFDNLLLEAFAELNVSEEVQSELINDRESLVLEITKPFLEDDSPYGRPIVQFPLGQIPLDKFDTPVLATYLSHLYVVKIALILPQGLGTYEAIVDSVDLKHRLLGHDLTLWKSISRVIRENASTDWLEDEIVLETYGGSMNRFAVNGSFVNEKLETVPSFRFLDSETINEDFELNPRVVNAFVRSVQQKMASKG